MKAFFYFILSVVFHNIYIGRAQESISVPKKNGDQSVVNVYCQNEQAKTTKREPENPPIEQGRPGKRGSIGPQGPTGPQGIKGDSGASGNDAQLNPADIRREIRNMIGTCEDFEQRSFMDTSHRLVISPENSRLEYGYCIFNTDISTCHQIRKDLRYNVNGIYYVRTTRSQPFYKLRCNFTTENAIIEVWHDEMNEVELSPKCEDKACYSWIPKYSLTNEKISNIIANSRECRQFVKLRCKGVLLLEGGYGHWISSDDQKMNYWGGATSRRAGYCACGETDSCVTRTKRCNCDNNSNALITSDEGYLTDKNKLPLKELRLGDNGDAGERAWRTIGKLECMG